MLPGFVDLQVNGFMGVNFSSPDLTPAALRDAFHAIIERGTIGFLPTVISSPWPIYERNLPLIARVAREEPFRGRVLGIHIEGPFISSVPGAVGAHNPDYVVEPDVGKLEQLLGWGDGAVRLLTVAAEVPGVLPLIRYAVSRGVRVSIGHSLFDQTTLAQASAAGATALTHLGNGLPNLLPRHPNPIWAGLAADAFTAMIIADGHHLPAEVVKVMLRAKGVMRTVVVSDASPVAGLPPGEYQVLGNRAILEPSGRLYNPDKQCLVGSTATMVSCMNFLASLNLLEERQLVALGYENPLRLLGLSDADIRPVCGQTLIFGRKGFEVKHLRKDD
ncbi:MAG TPA: N-acetylglucosamine-6-phosphate deacetylase [Chloroflexi bacterium]|nr:N-acetylglucosamine-6-phosphate deacetylase [Chloroflexota bacterium]